MSMKPRIIWLVCGKCNGLPASVVGDVSAEQRCQCAVPGKTIMVANWSGVVRVPAPDPQILRHGNRPLASR
jgi:hypothetical protein